MARKTLQEYLDTPYPYTVEPDPEGGFVVIFPDLPGCATVAETPEEIHPMAEEARRLWIETVYEEGMDVPEPLLRAQYSGRFVLRMPRSLHRRLAEAARRNGVSLNTYTVALIERALGSTAKDQRLERIERRLERIERRLVDLSTRFDLDVRVKESPFRVEWETTPDASPAPVGEPERGSRQRDRFTLIKGGVAA